MNKRTFFYIIAGVAFTATLLFTSSCSKSDDDRTTPKKEEPSSPVDPSNPNLQPGSDARPTWQTRSGLYTDNEQTMSVVIKLQDELSSFASADDLMCAVINGEIRAVTAPRQLENGTFYFPLIIAGNTGGEQISLSYYCSKLKRIYTNASWGNFSSTLSPTNEGNYYTVKFF